MSEGVTPNNKPQPKPGFKETPPHKGEGLRNDLAINFREERTALIANAQALQSAYAAKRRQWCEEVGFPLPQPTRVYVPIN